MKKYLFLGSFLLIAILGFSQTVPQDLKSKMPSVSSGELLSKLSGGIKPDSFVKGWSEKKGGWMQSAATSSDTKTSANLFTELVTNLKPSAFSSGFSKEGMLARILKVKNPKELGTSIKSLISGLKPNAFTKGFTAGKADYMKLLSGLK